MNLHEVPAEALHPLSRRAALTVHALHGHDRAWLLAQLSADDRRRLLPMLSELTALGITADPSLLADVDGPGAVAGAIESPQLRLAGLVPVDAPGPQDADQRFARQQTALGRLEPGLASRLLQAEPPGLIAQVLSIQAWPWRHVVLEQLGPVKRRRVQEDLDKLRRRVRPQPAALHRALVQALCSRSAEPATMAASNGPLRERRAVPSVGPAAAWLARVRQRLQPFTGGRP